jgi:GntR family transcriptional regulator/MocR family aminotransferase
MQLALSLDKSLPGTLTAQLVAQIRDAIKSGRIAPGARLPSSRRLSQQLGLSRNTIVRAYDVICAEGYAEGRPASGIFAAFNLPEAIMKAPRATNDGAGANTRMPRPPELPGWQAREWKSRPRLPLDFFPGQTHPGLFPIKTWRRILQTCLSRGGSIGLSQYGDPAGLQVLRSAIATHVAASRGIAADPGRVVIVNGAREAISIAAMLFLNAGARAVVENPGYAPAAASFRARGADLVFVGIESGGLRIEELPHSAALAYVTPSHQYPTGGMLEECRRRELVRWARNCGCYILEDDYDSDIRYEGAALPALAAIAPDCTLHIGTFSKTLGAALRIGYMIAPPQLAEQLCAAKELVSNSSAWLEQAALGEFLRSGSYEAYLIRARAYYLERRNALLSSMCRNFGRADIAGEDSGLHLYWRLPRGSPDASIVENLSRRARVGVYSCASSHAHYEGIGDEGERCLVLGYGALSPAQIDEGITRLAAVIRDASPPGARSRSSSEGGPFNLAHQTRQQPDLAAKPAPQALSQRKTKRARNASMPHLKSIYRYPIKGLSAQPVSSVVLEAGHPFPLDRIFALARPGSPIDPANPKWTKKGQFVMLMLDEALAHVKTHLDVNTLQLTVTRGNQQLLEANLNQEEDCAIVEDYFYRLVSTLRAAPKLVRSRGGHFMDKPDAVISLINLATVRSLEEQWGFEIDPLRFRANLYIDHAPPWEEFEWIGQDFQIGDAVFRVDRRNGRCGATNVNPVTGRRDLDIPGSLRTAFGHKDLGVYLTVRRGGAITVGDAVRAPAAPGEGMREPRGAPGTTHSKSFICGGCYFIYDDVAGLPQMGVAPGTSFADLPQSWVCPDCGTDKTVFRPYVRAT